MQRRLETGLLSVAIVLLVTTAASIAAAQSSIAGGESVRAAPSEVVGVLTPPPLDLPVGRRIRVSARPVERGEIAVIDGLKITVGPRRSLPADRPLRDPQSIALSGLRHWVDVAMPSVRRIVLSGHRQWVEVVAPPLRRLTLSGYREWVGVDVPPSRRLALSGYREWIELELPPSRTVYISFDPNWIDAPLRPPRNILANVSREDPDTILITEPLSTSAIIERLYPLDLFQVEARRRNETSSLEIR